MQQHVETVKGGIGPEANHRADRLLQRLKGNLGRDGQQCNNQRADETRAAQRRAELPGASKELPTQPNDAQARPRQREYGRCERDLDRPATAQKAQYEPSYRDVAQAQRQNDAVLLIDGGQDGEQALLRVFRGHTVAGTSHRFTRARSNQGHLTSQREPFVSIPTASRGPRLPTYYNRTLVSSPTHVRLDLAVL